LELIFALIATAFFSVWCFIIALWFRQPFSPYRVANIIVAAIAFVAISIGLHLLGITGRSIIDFLINTIVASFEVIDRLIQWLASLLSWTVAFDVSAGIRRSLQDAAERIVDLVDLAECQRRIRSGHNTRPTVSITFDDGYADNCSFALPLLLERGIPFTYFVTTRHLESGESFPHDAERGCHLAPNSVQTLQELARAGVEIGAHTRTHADIGAIEDPEQLHDELINGIRELESMIHRPVRYFAFPYGMPENMTAMAFRKLHDHGLAGVCSAYGGYNQIGGDPFHLQRIHGDPDFRRLKNWLTWDPRIGARNQFDWRDGDGACPTEDTRPRPIKPE